MTDDGRYLAGIRDTTGNPISRDEYAAGLEKEFDDADRQGTLSIKAADVYQAAELVDELAAAHKDEPFGRLARRLAVRLHDHLGY